jgi:hypothetical protein
MHTRLACRLRPSLGLLGVALLLALGLTWPLAAHWTTHSAGDGIDNPALAWNLWWIRERLVNQANPDIFHVGWMFHPIQINLAFYTLTPLNGLLSLPLQLGLSLTVANNLLLLSSFVLSALGAFLLVLDQRRWLAPSPSHSWVAAAALGGLLYAFASSKLFYASLGQFNIASSQWIPFSLLYLLRMAQPLVPAPQQRYRRRLYPAGMAALFITLQLWAELTYASFLAISLLLLLLWQLWLEKRRLWQHGLDLLLPYLLLATLVLLGALPLLGAMLPDLRSEGNFFDRGGGFADLFSADLLGYLLPTRLHPLWGGWVATLPFPNDKGQQIFVGYTATALSALGLWSLARQRSTRPLAGLWGSTLLLFFALTLGPSVRWAGTDTGIPGPFALVSQLPFFSGNRYPSRYSVMLLAAAAPLAGFGLLWLLARFPDPRRVRLGLSAALLLLFLFEHLALPLPLTDFRIPPIYQRLAAEAAGTDSALLELPTGWRNGARVLGRSDLLIMLQQWWQTAHGLRRLGGNTSRNPDLKFQYFTQAPLLGDLIALMNADRPHLQAVVAQQYHRLVARNRPIAPQVLAELGIRHVVVHEDKAPPELLHFIRDVLPLVEVARWQGPDWSGAAATTVLYRVVSPPLPPTRTVPLDGDLAPLYLAEGWATLPPTDGVRYATRPSPGLLVNLPATCTRLTFTGPDLAALLQRLEVNGQTLLPTEQHAHRVQVEVPARTDTPPVDQIVLHLENTPRPAGQTRQPTGEATWKIGDSEARLPAAHWIGVRSAGEEVGDFAQIFVDGYDYAGNERGYHLVALHPQGTVLAAAHFDTSGDPAASGALADWLAQWEKGTLVAGAVSDEASLQLDERAVAALQRAGVGTDLRGQLRWSHAFVGAVGAAPGSALEAAALLHPATVTVGAAVDGPTVYAGVRTLEIAPCTR